MLGTFDQGAKYFGIQGSTDQENLFDTGPSRPIDFGPLFSGPVDSGTGFVQ